MTSLQETRMEDTRIDRQLRFVLEIDRLKGVLRQTLLVDASRRENSAEHSWHLAMMAVLLEEHAPEGVALERVLRMLLVHDLVEIDAGDTFAYSVEGYRDKEARERAAAARLFSILPPDQAAALRALWEEFEAEETPEARYAVALDRLQPFLHNLHTEGGTWRRHGVSREQVLRRMLPIRDALPAVWPVVEEGLKRAKEEGWVG
jgi:putative hydrolase of HD superfamily